MFTYRNLALGTDLIQSVIGVAQTVGTSWLQLEQEKQKAKIAATQAEAAQAIAAQQIQAQQAMAQAGIIGVGAMPWNLILIGGGIIAAALLLKKKKKE